MIVMGPNPTKLKLLGKLVVEPGIRISSIKKKNLVLVSFGRRSCVRTSSLRVHLPIVKPTCKSKTGGYMKGRVSECMIYIAGSNPMQT